MQLKTNNRFFIGQAGHEEVPDKKSNILKGQEHLFNLEGQIAHKLELINNFIDRESRLHLVGHSIGAWLILELLKDNENLSTRISSVNLLFPTIQKMAETKNGKFINNILRTFHMFVMLLFHLLSLLPTFIINLLVESCYLKVQSLPLKLSKPIFQFLKPSVGEKILFLAYNEMDTVTNLNIAVLERIKKYTYIIYSTKDGWVPINYIDDLQMFQPQICLEKVDLEHAFVLKSSDIVAEKVSNFIKKYDLKNFK